MTGGDRGAACARCGYVHGPTSCMAAARAARTPAAAAVPDRAAPTYEDDGAPEKWSRDPADRAAPTEGPRELRTNYSDGDVPALHEPTCWRLRPGLCACPPIAAPTEGAGEADERHEIEVDDVLALAYQFRGERDDLRAERDALRDTVRARDEAIEALRALSEAATPGPWSHPCEQEVHQAEDFHNISTSVAETMEDADAAFIAAAANLVRAALPPSPGEPA